MYLKTKQDVKIKASNCNERADFANCVTTLLLPRNTISSIKSRKRTRSDGHAGFVRINPSLVQSNKGDKVVP